MRLVSIRDGNEPFYVNPDQVVGLEGIEGGRATMVIMAHGGTLRLQVPPATVKDRIDGKVQPSEDWHR